MEENLKQLLLKDLCARLPYGVIGLYSWKNREPYNRELTGSLFDELESSWDSTEDSQFLPYLRPMSSMTEEEDKEWQYYKNKIAESCDELLEDKINQCHDFFNAHHLDFRNLIERGLAIEVTEENNPYKE